MAKTRPDLTAELQRLRARLLDVDDGLSRLAALCRFGGLAADGMHGLHEDPSATALSFYFSLLGAEIEKLRADRAAAR
jgi:uncharacterized small protein (DUF1192 family)